MRHVEWKTGTMSTTTLATQPTESPARPRRPADGTTERSPPRLGAQASLVRPFRRPKGPSRSSSRSRTPSGRAWSRWPWSCSPRSAGTRSLRCGSAASCSSRRPWRAKLAAPTLVAQLATDPAFRERLAEKAVEAAGPLGAAVAARAPPGAGDPVEVAALAYLARPAGWRALVDAVSATAVAAAGSEQMLAASRQVEKLNAQLERVRANAKADADKLRSDLATVRAEADELRGRVRELNRSLRDAEQDIRRLTDAVSTERGRAAAASSASDAELRRARSRLADVEQELEAARSASRAGRSTDEAKLWLLLETIVDATSGLRRELAVGPPDTLPGDAFVAGSSTPAGLRARTVSCGPRTTRPGSIGLALPRVHLVIDGYNVTKTGFPGVALEQQRNRLMAGLAGLAAADQRRDHGGVRRRRAGAGLPPAPRGVRVLFSRPARPPTS